jgi:hypothetical protein
MGLLALIQLWLMKLASTLPFDPSTRSGLRAQGDSGLGAQGTASAGKHSSLLGTFQSSHLRLRSDERRRRTQHFSLFTFHFPLLRSIQSSGGQAFFISTTCIYRNKVLICNQLEVFLQLNLRKAFSLPYKSKITSPWLHSCSRWTSINTKEHPVIQTM